MIARMGDSTKLSLHREAVVLFMKLGYIAIRDSQYGERLNEFQRASGSYEMLQIKTRGRRNRQECGNSNNRDAPGAETATQVGIREVDRRSRDPG